MKIKLLHNSPLWLASNAIRMSHDNHHLSDTCFHIGELIDLGDRHICDKCKAEFDRDTGITINIGTKDKALIERVGNKLKHKSVLEQLVYWFEIDDISRGCLQELVRHRTARLTVKSTRYTLKELFKTEVTNNYEHLKEFLVLTEDKAIDNFSIQQLKAIKEAYFKGYLHTNDITKYALPEAFKTKLQWQIDGRNLQNFLELRTSKDAHWEIRELAYKIYEALPYDHKYLYEPYLYSNFKTKDTQCNNK